MSELAWTMHKFSTAATTSSGVRCALPVLRSVGLLNVLREYVCGGLCRAWRNALRSALSSLRDENLCIIRAYKTLGVGGTLQITEPMTLLTDYILAVGSLAIPRTARVP